MQGIIERLRPLAEPTFADFHAALIPNIPREQILGVRVPVLRKFAKELISSENCAAFLEELPHTLYDENMLHALLLSEEKDYERCLAGIEAFLPYIDNWAVCDSLRPRCFGKHKAALLPQIKKWIASSAEYTCRFGIETLMVYYLDDSFAEEYLRLPLSAVSEAYYVRMATAWYYATALAKQWDATLPYIQQNSLPQWIHEKAIQKACESDRLSKEQKIYLKKLK